MPLALSVVTPPPGSSYAVTVDEASVHLRLNGNDDDEMVEAMIAAAQEAAEAYLGRCLMPTTYDYFLDGFPADVSFLYYQRIGCSYIELPRPPVQSVTQISYIDANGATQTLSTSVYSFDSSTDPARILLKYGQVWPSTQEVEKSVTIRFVAGYATRADIPMAVRQAILLHVGTLYEHRESTISGTIIAEVPNSYHALLWPHRVAGSIL